ncbi:hypothetical protein BJ741DRAFT_591934 [Chytriomyces cf. hyalinus JEL632]|nr:hypothetical protein BJ741DRAFT_591934 [Chytriomyces cf. hyalinus JEL632]
MPYYDAEGNPKPRRSYNTYADAAQEPSKTKEKPAKWDWDAYWDQAIVKRTAQEAAASKRLQDENAKLYLKFDDEHDRGKLQKDQKESGASDDFLSDYASLLLQYGRKTQPPVEKKVYRGAPPTYSEDWWTDYITGADGNQFPGLEYWAAVQDFLADKIVVGPGHSDASKKSNTATWGASAAQTTNVDASGTWSSKIKSPKASQPAAEAVFLDDAPIFPAMATATVSSVAFFITFVISTGLMFCAVYEVIRFLKRTKRLAIYVSALEKMTSLNLSWVLILNDVEPHLELMKERILDAAFNPGPSEVEADMDPSIQERIDDGSGHPKKGRTLYGGDKWQSKTGISSTGGPIPNNFNALGWRDASSSKPKKSTFSAPTNASPSPLEDSFKENYFANQDRQTKHPANTSTTTKIVASLLSPMMTESPPYQFSESAEKGPKQAPMFSYHIRPRVIYPTRADPDRPALKAIPAPIAAVFDFSDQVWETAVDTAAWGVGITTVRPAMKVAKQVGKVVHSLEDWTSWGYRYSRQTARHALGLSKKKQDVEIVSNKLFA